MLKDFQAVLFKRVYAVFSLGVMLLQTLLWSVYNLHLIADVRLLLWQGIHSSSVQSAAPHRP